MARKHQPQTTMNTRQAEIDKFYEETGYLLEELQHGGLLWDGDMNLREKKVTTLPNELFVHGHLDLRGSSIEDLPEFALILGDLDIRDTNISEIPIDVYYKNILTTNENLRILWELEISNTTFAPRG